MKLRLFVILLMLSLTVVGCADSGISGEDPVLPYDYDEAAEKLKKHCAGFPTTFGIDEDCIYLNDVTGDGVEDLCTFIFFGSGMARMDIVLFDVVNDSFYTLDSMEFRGAYGYNYRILSVEDYGVVISEKQFYPEEHDVKFGLLTFEEGKLGMDEFNEDSSEYEHAKDSFEELQKGGMIIL